MSTELEVIISSAPSLPPESTLNNRAEDTLPSILASVE